MILRTAWASGPAAGFLRPVRPLGVAARQSHLAVLMGGNGRVVGGSISSFSSSLSSYTRQHPFATAAAAAAGVSTPTAPAPSNPITTTSTPRTAALAQVRAELNERGLSAFIIPSGDPHLSEYPADHFCRRAFISGFDGSAGTAVITPTQALLWTDGRYHLQAEQQLGPDWTLMREGQKDVPSIAAYLKEQLPADAVVGIDPTVHPVKFVQALAKTLSLKNIHVKPLAVAELNPIDLAWTKAGGRPPAPQSPVRVHSLEHAGETVGAKVRKLGEEMEKEKADILVAGTLDEVAWLLNVRGKDVPNCPLAVAYAVLESRDTSSSSSSSSSRKSSEKETKAIIFVEDSKLGKDAREHLTHECQAEIRPYGEIFRYLSDAVAKGKKVWLDPDKSNYALLQAASGLPAETVRTDNPPSSLVSKPSPIALLKALKNEAELKGMRAAHLRDGAAEVEFLAWLDKEVQARSVSEVEIDRVLTGFRAKREKFLGLSFDTIAGCGANGAVIHYRAMEGVCGEMGKETMLLLDSGAQYEDGTTDVTRTVHFGNPREEEKEAFTRVLQGHIGIDTAVFPEGTPGFVLDAYARRALWAAGLDYAHGTGHGVGAALNVHEGPHGISSNFANLIPLQVGMVVSNEPGFYASGQYGIRIENLLVVVEKEGLGGEGGRDPRKRRFLGFERLTHIPISKKLIQVDLLSNEEVEWIDKYHNEVRERVGPLVTSPEAKAWLVEATAPLVR
ncbi:hypothetical protein VYU27_003113 [Nannochloropsis oceanica]